MRRRRARRWRGGGVGAITTPHTQVRDVQDAVDADVPSRPRTAGSSGTCLLTATDGAAAVEAYALPGGGVGARCGVWGWIKCAELVADGGQGQSVTSQVPLRLLRACSMSASNAHIAALRVGREPLREACPEAERPQAKPSSGSMKDDDRDRSVLLRKQRRRP